jgi:peptidoglycan hydrolase-like protein with peptidoglycan-binding domain
MASALQEFLNYLEKVAPVGRPGVPAPQQDDDGSKDAQPDPQPRNNQPGSLPATTEETEPEYSPPSATEVEPTLRQGDDSADGWVEYLQQVLNLALSPSPNLPITGKFDAATAEQVRQYQIATGLTVDGIVGNQTWTRLRRLKVVKPGTDGRKPHSFVEKGAKARWQRDKDGAGYDGSTDQLRLPVFSVGDAEIEGQKAYVFITAPGTKRKGKTMTIPPPTRRTPDDQGNLYFLFLDNFRKTYPSDPPDQPVKDYLVEAYLDKELGGDHLSGGIIERSPSSSHDQADNDKQEKNQATTQATEWTSLGINAGKKSMIVGEQQQLKATADTSDGSPPVDATQSVTWTSSAPDVLAIDDKDHKGLATAGPKIGSATITASDPSGKLSITVDITVTAATAPSNPPPTKETKQPFLQEIRVFPDREIMFAHESQQLKATGLYSDGSSKDLTSHVEWQALPPGLDVVGKVHPNGVVEAYDQGALVIQATDPETGIHGSDEVTVGRRMDDEVTVKRRMDDPPALNVTIGVPHGDAGR